jgi:hypothetical protein
VLSLLIAACSLGAAPELSDATFDQLADAIRPRESELAFLKIGWHESFHSAVNEARQTGLPILLWAMNGHPLGCT